MSKLKVKNKRNKQSITLSLLFLLSLFFPLSIYSEELKLLNSDSNSLVYEFTAKGIKVDNEIADGEVFHKVSIQGLGKTNISGAPILPVKGKLIDIPSGKKLSFKILEARYKIYKDFNLLSYPKIYAHEAFLFQQGIKNNENNGVIAISKRFYRNERIYSEDKFYPQKFIDLKPAGYIRERKVALLKIFPVQYNPVSKEMRFYSKIKIKILFEGDDQKIAFKPAFSPKPSIFSNSQFPPLKISVKEDGFYSITFEDLKNAGIDPSSIDPRFIKIFNNEKEIAIFFSGEDDGKFDEGDYFEFYGERNRGEFTATNIYWLIVNGGSGKRMEISRKLPSKSPPFERSFKAIYHGEENKEHIQPLPREEGKDHWFWQRIGVGIKDLPSSYKINFTLTNIKKSKNKAAIKVSLQGLTDPPFNPDHHTRVYLNDKLVDEASWNGEDEYLHNAEVSNSSLKNGENTLEIKSIGDTGAPFDAVVLNWFEIEYYKQFVAEDNSLTFSKSGNKKYQFRIKGFSKNTVKAFDITDPYNVKLIKSRVKKINGEFALLFKDEIRGEKKYFAISKDKIKKPDSITIDEQSDLKSSENGADYIIITHEDFYDTISQLKGFRESQGLRIKVVKITDVYDEFSSGNFTPDAIRDFLKFAYENWQPPAPTYVLLVGDANYDYKDYMKKGFKNYVPVKLVQTSLFGPTPSDNWFACINGDDKYPDMYIGRIPAKTKEQVEAVVNKILSYENNQPFSEWNKNIILIADNTDEGGNFESLSDNLANIPPSTFLSKKIYLTKFSNNAVQAKAKIIEDINVGALITNYAGHGSLSNWAAEEMFTSEDLSSLNNADKLTFVVTLNCLNGFFPDYEKESLGEEFLLAENGGAIAFWGPTGLGFNSDYERIGSELFKKVFQEGEVFSGKAVTDALISAVSNYSLSDDYLEDLVYFGDPALQLGLPE